MDTSHANRPRDRAHQRGLIAASLAVLTGLALAGPAMAWGNLGHQTIALLARHYLTPTALGRVDALLASDPDTLTAPDMASRATWADVWRNSHRNTAPWHFADVEIDGCNTLDQTCGLGDCVVSRLEAFEATLANPAASPSTRIAALKFVLHFAGDLHQPLHLSDNHDRGGNCVWVRVGARTKLHAYWDTDVVQALGSDAQSIADRLVSDITPVKRKAWARGDIRAWAMETNRVGVVTAYSLHSAPGCGGTDETPLPTDYANRSETAAAIQLERAGVRLAVLLNRAFAGG